MAEEQDHLNDNDKPRARTDGVEEELEEGEIIDGGDDETSSSAKPAKVVSHPLEYSWTFWFDSPTAKSKQTSWGSSMCPIYTFSTVEEFWSVSFVTNAPLATSGFKKLQSIYNNMHHPSKLAHRTDFYCFKHKIEPKWEDPVCANGGNWTMSISKGKLDNSWLYTLLAMIGEQFDHGEEICGAVVNVRTRQEKISLWTKNATNEGAQVSIGRQWKRLLDSNETIGFIFHDDAIKFDKGAKNKHQPMSEKMAIPIKKGT
ncbi:hypothetical protein RJ639_030150 [Escallonia herrerae]|uniref:eIF-4F 25 kDa subunit n=1 Tax=Escallonia herrerae TaxID=1293975 RepID=A0AA88X5R6_9ASTE|nr:hypothetical protein RJ639_030150 [Escallonia herrerae]